MSEEEKMFKKLGYAKSETDKFIVYENLSCDKLIKFYKMDKKYESVGVFKWITMQELQAINEKVKELGWLNE